MRFAVAFLALATALAAQNRPAPVLSPEVGSDRSVTFRLRAPNAKEVRITGIGQPVAMARGEDGVWTARVGPLDVDLYSYSFSVDGVSMLDPGNPRQKTLYMGVGQSLLHVPGQGLSWERTDGPRGSVNHHFYKSTLIGDERDFWVYTPPNYDPSRKDPYPVLYLLHGASDDSDAWSTVGRANVILDNLINQGKAKPMIMVNPLGYGDPNYLRNPVRDANTRRRNQELFGRALLEEVMPQVEKAYRVSHDRAGRALAGLSMGGGQTLFTGLNHLDKFAYLGAFSSAVGQEFDKAFPSLTAKSAGGMELLWIACGVDDGLITSNREFKKWLKEKNIPFTEVETPGAHSWPVWRRNLTDFAPLLFQGKK